MTDIFLSYGSEDRPRARLIADALEAEGWDVWWDREIRAGERFDHSIDQAITQARCIVVLWSRISVGKNWVLEEAADGRDRGVLVPVKIDEVALPRGFRRIQAASLVGWDGNTDSPPFRRLMADIAAVAKGEPKPAAGKDSSGDQTARMAAWQQRQASSGSDESAPAAKSGGARTGPWALAGLMALVVIAALGWFAVHRNTTPIGRVPVAVSAKPPIETTRVRQPPYEVRVVSTAVDGVALKRSPRDDTKVVARLLEKSRLSVTGPAVEADGQSWLPVRLDKGWIAEGEIDPARPRLLEPLGSERIQVQGLARVRYPRADGLNLRQGPNLASPVIAALYKGSVMKVIGTPERLQGYLWWLVRVPEGWISEGRPGGPSTVRPID